MASMAASGVLTIDDAMEAMRIIETDCPAAATLSQEWARSWERVACVATG
jgi:hypothetical protein